MNTKWIVFALVSLLLGLLGGFTYFQTSTAQDPKKGPRPAEIGERSPPPELKVGVRIQFLAPAVNSMVHVDERAPKVGKIQGNWIYIDGEVRGAASNIKSGWVNFDTVSWYRILTEKDKQ